MTSHWVRIFLAGGFKRRDRENQNAPDGPTPPTAKRKRVDRPEDLDNDLLPVPHHREALSEVSLNKRRRYLDHVLVKRIDHDQPTRHMVSSPARPSSVGEAAVSSSQGLPVAFTHPNGPPRRMLKRSTAAQEFDDIESSADELAYKAVSRRQKARAPTQRKTSRATSRADADFVPTTSSEEEHADDATLDGGTTSGKASASDDSTPDTKPTKKAKSKAAQKVIDAPKKAIKKNMRNLMKGRLTTGLYETLPPLSNIDMIFKDIADRALQLGLKEVLAQRNGMPLQVATMCSGTESPVLGLQKIQAALSLEGIDLQIEHIFSAEIVAFKQAYIERNFHPRLIFRDITEMINAAADSTIMATTVYGSKVPVPADIDVLIVGTSCVDFSRLNNKRKGIHEKGESGNTFTAVLDYCKVARPPIVILENVYGAPYDTMLENFEHVGYLSTGMHVDTKDFYLPQTRRRGYMVCLDKHRLADGMDESSTREELASLVEKFKRPASSPVLSFLLRNPRSSSAIQVEDDNTRRDVDWALCSLRHSEQRAEWNVGKSRPYSHWDESGASVPPDHGTPQWLASQVERVKDFTDIATLRKVILPKGAAFDPRYKTRFWDSSQNIDKERDIIPFGMLGCITPSGDPIISDQSRLISSIEKLGLQGIDTKMISLTTETARQVSDMAGNAMSSTVVTPIILSALIVGSSTLSRRGPEAPQRTLKTADTVLSDVTSGPQHTTVLSKSLHDIVVADLLALAKKTLRQCSCEGDAGLTKNTIQRCLSCGHTACGVCSGNPEHEYLPGQSVHSQRLEPVTFVDYLKSVFPLRIRPPQPKRLDYLPQMDHADPYLHETYIARIKAVSREVFGRQDSRRSFCWTIVYRSETSGSRIEFRLDGTTIDLQLYVEPPSDLAVNHPLRDMFKNPVAIASATTSLSQVQWRWRSSAKTMTTATIDRGSEESRTMWSRWEIPKFQNLMQPQTLYIGPMATKSLNCDVEGTWELLPSCGTSFESMYRKKTGHESTRPLYLFHDPDKLGPPEQDSFVFSTNCERLEVGETRYVEAWMTPTWRPWYPLTSVTDVDIFAYEWIVLPGTLPLEQIQTSIQTAGIQKTAAAISPTACMDFTEVLAIKTATACETKEQLLNTHKWLSDVIKLQLPMSKWLPHSGHEISSCQTCAPSKPAPKWQLHADGVSIVRYEDPQGAADYEKAVKRQPTPAVVQIEYKPGHPEPTTRVTLGVNLNTMAHRARAALPLDISAVAYQWRYMEAATGLDAFARRPFSLKAIDSIAPFDGDLDMAIDDFKHQRLSLAWMREQERGKPCVIEGSRDAALPHLDLRIELRAISHIEIRGGILADPPGYGKTILSLALIRVEEFEQTAEKVLANMEPRRPDGLIPTPATLVVVPPNIVQQWADEILHKLGYEDGVISISKTQQLSKLTIEDFEKAKVVVISRTVLTSDPYIGRVAAFAGLPGPVGLQGREHQEWLRFAASNISKHATVLKEEGIEQLQATAERTYKAVMESDSFNEYLPSRRLRGKDYQAAQRDRNKPDTKKAAPAVLDISKIGAPLLEMFYWNRLMIDEFHELNARDFAAVVNIKADKRWGLSGTPPIGDSYEVSQMARLLGAWLPKGSMRQNIMKQKNARALQNEMTDFERFDAQREAQSDAMQERIYELSQEFLNAFVRQNDGFNIPYEDHLVPVNLDLAHQVVYSELSMQLIGQDMVVKKASKKKRKVTRMSDRDERYFTAVQDVSFAEEALSRSAAFISCDNADRDQDALTSLIDDRKARLYDTLGRLSACVSAAKSEESERFAGWKVSRIDGDGVGDAEVTAMVREVCEGTPDSTKQWKDDWSDHDMDAEVKSKGYHTSKALGLVNDLLVSQRSLRYAQNVRAVQAEKLTTSSAKHCSSSDCKATTMPDIAVSSACGHTTCFSCYIKRMEQGLNRCAATGCSLTMERYHMLWKSKMTQPLQVGSAPYGAKIAVALDLLETICEQDDQAILFVQFANQVDELRIALADRGIAFATEVKDFQRVYKNVKEKKTVIILNASGDGAAGLNLQNANHVIFMSPLLRDQQQVYDGTMEQAIGRVRRYGQKKKIHVYRLVALDTVDVDILELRERRPTALTEQDGPEVARPTGVAEDALMVDGDGMDTLVGGQKQNSMQLVRNEQGCFSLRPRSWLMCCQGKKKREDVTAVTLSLARNRNERVQGWGDFGTLEKWSPVYVEGDD